MKTIKYTIVMILGAFLLASCEQDNGFVNSVQDSPNLAIFADNSQNVSQIADGSEYEIGVPIKIDGPSLSDVSGDVMVTVEPDFSGIPGSERAEEGTNFRIDDNTITLKESNNYLGTFTFTMITAGITAPKSPKFNLKATETSGGGNILASGKPLALTLNYACDSNLQGTYNVVATRDDGTVFERDGEEITVQPGLGQYVTGSEGGFWNAPGSPYRPQILNHGLFFSDVCGNLTVADGQNLGGIFGNEVGGVETTEVTGNSQTGNLTSFTLKYFITFGGTPANHTAVYTKQ
jgi:PBP1b-binding outer membrane lipoprotein LpoB